MMSLRFRPFLWWFILVFQFISNCNFAKSSNSSRFLYGCSYGSQVSNTTEINRLRDLTKGMGATATGCQCSWSDIQASSNSSYNFTKCDTQFELQTNAGFECFSYSGFTPDWALNASILAKYGSGIGYRFPPANKWIAQFEAAYTAIAQRYDNIIKYWEFGNEPNGCGWIEDNCANSDEYTTYVPWLQRWYNSMKKGSNNTVLSIGGLDYNNNGGNNANNASKYLIGIYENGGGNYFDAVAIHPYAQQEIYWTGLQDTYNVLKAYNDSEKQIWINEYGWNTNDENAKSQYLQSVLTKLKANHSEVFQACYLQIQDLPNSVWGLVNVDSNTGAITPRQAWYTFAEFPKN